MNTEVGVQVRVNPSPPTRIVIVEEARDSVEVKVVVTAAAIEVDERSLIINADATKVGVVYLVEVVVVAVIRVIAVEAIVESGDGGKDTIVETVERGMIVQIVI